MAIPEEHISSQLPMWDKWHSRHVADDDSPLHIACRDDLLSSLPSPACSGPVLELGSGQGYDAVAISGVGYAVEALEFSEVAVALARHRLSANNSLRVNYVHADISHPLPYPQATFSGIFSYLALHYFDVPVTQRVFAEITRVAARSCVFSFGVRSVEDPLFGKGRQLGKHIYINNGHLRHFFDLDELVRLLSGAWTIQELRHRRSYYLTKVDPEGDIIKGLAIRD